MAGEILVIGGGISGLTAAIEAAETGYDVILVEKNPYLGGRVSQLNKYFPKLCPPFCGLEILFKRMKSTPRLKYFTNAEVQEISGEPGNFTVKVKIKRDTSMRTAQHAALAGRFVRLRLRTSTTLD